MTTLDELNGAAKAERKPGDFKRNAKTGAPYVSVPTGDKVKTGARKGEPKWVLYGRPSGFGHQIENTTNLQKWTERQIILGLATQHNLLAEAIRHLSDPNADEDAWRNLADGIVAKALEAAKASLAADQGTHSHGLTEDDDTGADWLTRAEAGEELDIPREVQAGLVAAWRKMLADYGLEVLAAEIPVVNDNYRQAGTLDRIVRLTRDLSFMIEGEIIVVPADTVLVLDLKTGRLRLAEGYWNSYAVQIAAYASSVPYDTATEKRRAWDWPLNERWALIAHLPVGEAMEGTAVCRLILVDLKRGHHAAALCMAARAWEASRDAFGLTHGEPEISVAVEPCAAAPATDGADSHPAPVDGGTAEAPAPATAVDPFDDLVPGDGGAPALARSARGWKATMPDESERIADESLPALMVEAYNALDSQRQAVLNAILNEAKDAGVPFGQLAHFPTVRRFEATRLVFRIVKHMHLDPENSARAAIRLVMGDRPEVDQAPLGALIGALSVDELRKLCTVVEDYGDGQYQEDWSSFPMRLNRAA